MSTQYTPSETLSVFPSPRFSVVGGGGTIHGALADLSTSSYVHITDHNDVEECMFYVGFPSFPDPASGTSFSFHAGYQVPQSPIWSIALEAYDWGGGGVVASVQDTTATFDGNLALSVPVNQFSGRVTTRIRFTHPQGLEHFSPEVYRTTLTVPDEGFEHLGLDTNLGHVKEVPSGDAAGHIALTSGGNLLWESGVEESGDLILENGIWKKEGLS